MKLVYPAIFYPCEGKGGFTVIVPDLPGCVTEGQSLADAILMGTDAASGWLLGELEDSHPLPKASDLTELQPGAGGIVSLLAIDMDAYSEKFGAKAIRKNITIPAFMNSFVERNHLSLSKITQDALSSMMLAEA